MMILVIILGLLVKTKQKILPERFLSLFLGLVAGVCSLEGFIMHAFFSDFTARAIGWPAGNPFQYEVSIANLTISVLGFTGAFIRNSGFRAASVIAFSIWLFGDGVGHLIQISTHHNMSPGNAGSILYTDIFLPLIGLSLLIWAQKQKKA
jgi:hypothetical protein